VINGLLLNQQVSITQEDLDKILKIPGVKFDLPLTDQTFPAYFGLVGKPKARGRRTGIYILLIFRYVPPLRGDYCNKYVGSSNNLSRRLSQYFNRDLFINKANTGLLLPLMVKDGLGAFTLEIAA